MVWNIAACALSINTETYNYLNQLLNPDIQIKAAHAFEEAN